MPKIENWSNCNEVDYQEIFLDSPYDRNAKPVVWEFDGVEDLFYVLYKADEGTYHTENFGEDVEKLDELLPDVGSDVKLRKKNRARNMATDVLKDNSEPFDNKAPEDMDMKERARYWFETVYDILYVPNEKRQVSKGYKLTSLQKRSSKYAHIQRYGFTVSKLGIDWSHWERSSDEERLRILIHELTHLRHSNHKEEFWHDLANHTNKVYSNRDEFAKDFDWRDLARRTIRDVNRNNLDLRVSNVNDMRRNMESWLNFDVKVDDNYSSDRYENLWDKVRIIEPRDNLHYLKAFYGKESFNRGMDDYVWDEEFSLKELWEFFSDVREKNKQFGTWDERWHIPPAKVEDEGFEKRESDLDRDESISRTYVPCSREDAMKLEICKRFDGTVEIKQEC